jgi:uncharacterized membrane protein
VSKSGDEVTYTIRGNAVVRRTVLLIPVLFYLLLISCSRQTVYPPAPQSGTDVVIEVAALQPEVPKFYTYINQGKNISFFLIKVQDRVLAFLDACASCYPHKQGFRFENGSVSCRYCNMQFPVRKLEQGIGGCYPIKLEGRIDNGQFRIPVKSLEAAADKF